MKKLLLSTAAVALGLSLAAPAAQAQIELSVGGHFKGYMAYTDQDDENVTTTNQLTDTDPRSIDILRETELHVSGETTLDNGLTVGAHFELDLEDTSADTPDVEEAYVYWSGNWGRVNFGKEDGVAYLLQVAAPSADSNIDGLRQFVQPLNFSTDILPGLANTTTGAPANADDEVAGFAQFLGGTSFDLGTEAGASVVANLAVDNTVDTGDIVTSDIGFVNRAFSGLGRLDYDLAVSGFDNKISYLTPVFSGFQAGVSYTPELGDNGEVTRNLNGVNLNDTVNDFGATYGIAARYEGQFDELGVAIGIGYESADLEEEGTLQGIFVSDAVDAIAATDTLVTEFDDRNAWNAGIDFDWGPFGLGFAYVEDDLGIDKGADRETFVVGADYTTGPFKLGVSYLMQDQEIDALVGNGLSANFTGGDLEAERFTGGVVYTYGPGMTFRGSVSYVEYDASDLNQGAVADLNDDKVDATSVLIGTQIRF